jgi:hypothetical protein
VAVIAQTIIDECELVLQDQGNIRWSMDELLTYISEAQRVIIKAKPNAYALTQEINLVVGTRQTLPADGVQLLDIIRNSDAMGGKAVRQTAREDLDGVNPDWHSDNASSISTQFTYDTYDPLAFYVYPPSDGLGTLVALYSAIPPPVDDSIDAVSIPDFYQANLVDYTLYRCYQKDAEDAANMQLAQMFYQQFISGLSLIAQTEDNFPPAVG